MEEEDIKVIITTTVTVEGDINPKVRTMVSNQDTNMVETMEDMTTLNNNSSSSNSIVNITHNTVMIKVNLVKPDKTDLIMMVGFGFIT